jgi:transposase
MDELKEKFAVLLPHLNEKTRRLVAAAEVINKPRGAKGEVSKATGVSYREIQRGLRELREEPTRGNAGGIRKKGGGRKETSKNDPEILAALKELVDSSTRGDPCSPLLWTSKSLRKLSDELKERGHKVSHVTVGKLLEQQGYSLQANRKVLEGASHPDRNAQFEHISMTAKEFQSAGQPVISVDCKKHELVGNYKNSGREYHQKGESPKVKDHDFMDKELGKAIPYGVYDITDDTGFVNVGIDHDTSVFAAESIRCWWLRMGKQRYPDATRLMITADCGGSNGYRRRLWKSELSKFAKETGLRVTVCHFPVGTSKWNKIEHRLFSFITLNWRAKPLTTIEIIVNLIAATKTAEGLNVECVLDEHEYPHGLKTSKEEFDAINIVRDQFHGDWNYTIAP